MKKLLTLAFTALLATTAQANFMKYGTSTADRSLGTKTTIEQERRWAEPWKYQKHVTELDGKMVELLPSSKDKKAISKTLQMLEEAMAENNRLTTAYLKTNSPAWKDLMTDELKANGQKFENAWKRIVIDRHYNKDVLDAYEKYATLQLENKDKMYAHFYTLSKNEPFKEKVKNAQRANKNHLLNDKAAIKYLRTLL